MTPQDALLWQENLTQAAFLYHKVGQAFCKHCSKSIEAFQIFHPLEDIFELNEAFKKAKGTCLEQGVQEFFELCKSMLHALPPSLKIKRPLHRHKKDNPLSTHVTKLFDQWIKKNKELLCLFNAKLNDYLSFQPDFPPLLWKKTLEAILQSRGKVIVKALENFLHDIHYSPYGFFTIEHTDSSSFKVGENIATTPGKVVFRNELVELIQYAPKTKKVYSQPLLIIPPWINKYYILDLTEEKSLVAWLVEQGFTVFIISWLNPTFLHKEKGFEHYVEKGLFASLKAIRRLTNDVGIHTMGYCIGGTLLAVGLSLLSTLPERERPAWVKTATFLAAQLDFSKAGILKNFATENRINRLESLMKSFNDFLPGPVLTQTFNMLNPRELIWTPLIKKYLLGEELKPFDILYWNSDATNMFAKAHSFYLRQFYLENAFAQHKLPLFNRFLSPTFIHTPSYFLATLKDHIVPWPSVFEGAKNIQGETTFVLGDSGHVAGIVNPEKSHKYRYWTKISSPSKNQAPLQWLNGAQEHRGSWWPHWQKWVKNYTEKQQIPARFLPPHAIDAPGHYVFKKWFESLPKTEIL